jgi:EmrB/QacA subfamily drug resistance transporter
VIGVLWFALASLACGIAPNLGTLIAARLVQGVGGALLTPGSLAIIQASFVAEDRGKSIGAWSGLGSIAIAIGPLLGGYLTQAISWRWIFLINLPVAALVAWIAVRHVPETSDPDAVGPLDVAGAVLAFVGLGGTTYALIEAPNAGWRSPLVRGAAIAGLVSLVAFVLVEARRSRPMLPLSLFKSRAFSGTNVLTFAMYGALSAVIFLLILQLQQVVGYSPVAAGLATLPVTLLLLVLSPYAGQLGQRIGARIPLTVGPLVTAAGVVGMARVDRNSSYLTDVLPPLMVFGVGLACVVAPLTTTVMAAVVEQHAGVASAINNAVARVAGLVAVALLPALAGLSGDAYLDPDTFSGGYRIAMLIAGGLSAAAGFVGWLTLRDGGPAGYASTNKQ